MRGIDRTARHAEAFGLAAVLGGFAWLVLSVVQATNLIFDEILDSPIDYVNDGTFTVALVCTAVAMIGLKTAGVAPRPAALLAAGGYLLIAVGVIAGLVLGYSPDWFAIVGLPGNLLAIIGMIWLGVAIIRHRPLPIWVGVLAIFAGLFAVVMSELGTSIFAAVFWLYIGARLLAPTPTRFSPSSTHAAENLNRHPVVADRY